MTQYASAAGSAAGDAAAVVAVSAGCRLPAAYAAAGAGQG